MSGSGFPGGLFPAQYAPQVGAPSHVSCWALLGATTHDWGATSALVANAWAVLTPNTYASYCLGENFTLVATEDYPLITTEDRPLIIPPDSGFSSP